MSGALSTANPAERCGDVGLTIVARGSTVSTRLGESHRAIHRVALREIDEDRGDRAVLACQVDAGDHVGHVFLFGQGRRFAVRCIFRKRVDRSPSDIGMIVRVRMERNEQIGPRRPRDIHPLAQRNENVAVARQLHAITARRLERFAQFLRDRRARDPFPESRCAPCVPGSIPPCPASTTTRRFSASPRFTGAVSDVDGAAEAMAAPRGQPAAAANSSRVEGVRSIISRKLKPSSGGTSCGTSTFTGLFKSTTKRKLPLRNWP